MLERGWFAARYRQNGNRTRPGLAQVIDGIRILREDGSRPRQRAAFEKIGARPVGHVLHLPQPELLPERDEGRERSRDGHHDQRRDERNAARMNSPCHAVIRQPGKAA